MNQIQNDELWSKWAKIWKKETATYGMPDSCKLFFDIFEKSYNYSEEKLLINKKWNFGIKIAYIIFLFLLLVAQIIMFFKWIWPSLPNISLDCVCAIEIPLLLFIILGTMVVVKILDIKKYQETYARHKRFQNLREMEMLRFIMEKEKKNENHKNDDYFLLFMKQIMEIERSNVEKYCDNLEQKEKNLMDGLDILGFKTK